MNDFKKILDLEKYRKLESPVASFSNKFTFQTKTQLSARSDEDQWEPRNVFTEKRTRGKTEGYVRRNALITKTRSTASNDE